MNGCERIRDFIADFVSSDDRRMPQEVELHVKECAKCREFLSDLLRDDERLAAMTGSMKESIGRVEQSVMDRIKDEKRPAAPVFKMFRGRGSLSGSGWTKVPKPAAAAAAVLLVLWVFSGKLGRNGGSSEVFAMALRNAASAENVTYREIIQIDGVDISPIDVAINRANVHRSTFEHGDVVIRDFNKGLKLQIFSNSDRAELTRSTGRDAGGGSFDYIKWLSTLHAESGTFVGSEKIGGKATYRFDVEQGDYHTSTVWVDPAVNLPVQIEHIYESNTDSTVVLPSIVLSLRDFGGKEYRTRSYSISNPGLGIQEIMKMIAMGMAWNVALDESLFSFEPPKGYKIFKRELDESFEEERDLIEAFSLWAKISGGSFPENIEDLADSAVVNNLLIAAYNGDGDPDQELDEAMKAAQSLLKGLYFAMTQKADGEWTYNGGGVRMGDAKRPVCWWKSAGDSCRVIYGDLHIASAGVDELPRRP